MQTATDFYKEWQARWVKEKQDLVKREQATIEVMKHYLLRSEDPKWKNLCEETIKDSKILINSIRKKHSELCQFFERKLQMAMLEMDLDNEG
jgi:hypothetical protein